MKLNKMDEVLRQNESVDMKIFLSVFLKVFLKSSHDPFQG